MNSSIIPYLWFDSQAEEAASFYTSLFQDSRITSHGASAQSSIIGNYEIDTVETNIIEFELVGKRFLALNGGMGPRFNPAISLTVTCRYIDLLDELWAKLSLSGKIIMDYRDYPFAKRYGWVNDKFGLSWQLMFVEDEQIIQKVTPTLLFVGEQAGNAGNALRHYTSLFDNAYTEACEEYGPGNDPNLPEHIEYARVSLNDFRMIVMDSSLDYKFEFNKSISFVIMCDTQQEIDFFWSKLSADPDAERCGWVKDHFGVSWQIVPSCLSGMVSGKDREGSRRVIDAFLQMKKINIEALERAYNSKAAFK